MCSMTIKVKKPKPSFGNYKRSVPKEALIRGFLMSKEVQFWVNRILVHSTSL